MLLANNTLHFGSVKNNNEIVVLCSSCHDWMILLCDSSQPCKPCNTAYILAASHWSPGVPKSVGIRAFTMWKGEKNFWELGNLKKRALSYIRELQQDQSVFRDCLWEGKSRKEKKKCLKGLECLKKKWNWLQETADLGMDPRVPISCKSSGFEWGAQKLAWQLEIYFMHLYY